MKLQQEVWGQARETLGPWNNWLMGQEHSSVLLHPSSCRKYKRRKSQQICTWLWASCHQWNFGVFDHRSVYMTPGLLATDEVYLSQRYDLHAGVSRANWKSFKLDVKRKRGKMRHPSWLEFSKCDTHLQEGLKEDQGTTVLSTWR